MSLWKTPCPDKLWGPKTFVSEKIFGQRNFGQKKSLVKKILVRKILGLERTLGSKKLWVQHDFMGRKNLVSPNFFGSIKKFLVQKIICLKNFWVKRMFWLKLRAASRNMVRQCGSESHNHLPPFPYGLVVFA